MNRFSLRTRLSLGMVLLFSVIILGSLKLLPSLAQQNSSQEKKSVWQVKKVEIYDPQVKSSPHESLSPTEKVIENRIPTHLPIGIEIKGLDKEALLSNLEIKVTNKSAKPIYMLSLQLVFSDSPLSQDGVPMIIPLRYGRYRLAVYREPILPEDVPILPGESTILKVPTDQISGFEAHLSSLNSSYSEVKMAQIFFDHLTFSDKTGFTATNGVQFPSKDKRISENKGSETLKGLPEKKSVWQVKKVEIYDPQVKSFPHESLSPAAKVIENRVPKHLPIAIEFQGLDNDDLLPNLAIKVTNQAAKPIYLLDMDLRFQEVLSQRGLSTVINLRFGRLRLAMDNGRRVRHHGRPLSLPPQGPNEGQSVTDFLAEVCQAAR